MDTDVLVAGSGPTGLTLALEWFVEGSACELSKRRIASRWDHAATESRLGPWRCSRTSACSTRCCRQACRRR